jgi:hypothetical protein
VIARAQARGVQTGGDNDRVLIDVNALFSAADRAGGALERLWEAANIALLSSPYAIEEANRNLTNATRGRDFKCWRRRSRSCRMLAAATCRRASSCRRRIPDPLCGHRGGSDPPPDRRSCALWSVFRAAHRRRLDSATERLFRSALAARDGPTAAAANTPMTAMAAIAERTVKTTGIGVGARARGSLGREGLAASTHGLRQ